MEKEIDSKKIIVLKPLHSKEEVSAIANKKKTGLFGNVFSRPKEDEVEVTNIELFYETYWLLGGHYHGDYFRKNVYDVNTDYNVTEVIIGKGTFPVTSKSGTWDKFKKSIKVGEKENKLKIPVEEHVLLDVEEEIALNAAGKEIEFKYKIKPENLENFPEDILKQNESNIRKSTINEEEAITNLVEILKQEKDEDVRMIKEKISINKLQEVFIPIFEARCLDSNNKVAVLRIDPYDLKVL
ncbi:MAG: hypothetical protein R3237_00775 [Nitrosopumilaceae archaeon]|nr:hypothetical protein [Nitrosopumilaceae archaeon]